MELSKYDTVQIKKDQTKIKEDIEILDQKIEQYEKELLALEYNSNFQTLGQEYNKKNLRRVNKDKSSHNKRNSCFSNGTESDLENSSEIFNPSQFPADLNESINLDNDNISLKVDSGTSLDSDIFNFKNEASNLDSLAKKIKLEVELE
ncbi:hypothetical protein K502DRAFT_325169 [Neoconidiobolus thromboides FSU 785]|nr:hypothetical protein K502DRAFT_325169 [Neoconidiobolus thromboides FSU 785]